MRLDVTATQQGMDLFGVTDRFMDELHGLEHQEGRLDCTVGVTRSRSGVGSLDVELNVDEMSIEIGFSVAMAWLRTALKQANIPEPEWRLRRIEMDINESHLPGPRVLKRPAPRSGAA
jgi:hypothetical protein